MGKEPEGSASTEAVGKLGEGIFGLLPRINVNLPSELVSVNGITGPRSLLYAVFPNLEQLFNTPWWAKFIERYLFKSPISALMEHLNLNLFDKNFWKAPLPGLFNSKGRGQER